MRRHQTEKIGNVLRDLMREQGLETPLAEHRIVEAWPRVVGPSIDAYTGQIYVRNGVLYVQIRSASLRQNLMMTQQALLARLCEQAGETIVTRIHFF